MRQLIAFKRDRLYTSLEKPEKMEGQRLKLLGALTNELLRYGYYLSPEVMLFLSEEDIKEVWEDVIPYLIDLYHSGEQFQCLYPGFPDQVYGMTDEELELNQRDIYDGLIPIDDFITSSAWYKKSEIDSTSGNSRVMLKRMTNDEFMSIPQSIMSSGNSIQEWTKKELVYFLSTYPALPIPERIPFKETLCIVMAERKNYEARDINDLLRFALYTMGCDPCLPTVSKTTVDGYGRRHDNPEWRNLKGLKRYQRREILERIDIMVAKKGLDYVIPEAKRFYGHWVLLNERLHSGDYKNVYPRAFNFFHALLTPAENKKYKTWNSKLQSLYDEKKPTIDITKYISSRPGELVRRFDSLLRRAQKEGIESDVMDVFLDTAGMNNKTLLELLSYYDKRGNDAPRFVSVPGSNRKYQLPSLSVYPKEVLEFIQDMIERKVLINIDERTKEKDMTGKLVYLDPELKNIPIPRDMRSAIDIIPPCTKFRIPEDKSVIRFFVHWIQKGRSEDLDLHAYFVDSDLKEERNIGWNSGLRDEYSAHSGDVLNREGDCAEYVDVNIEKARTAGFRYVVMDVKNFKGRDFNSLPSWLGFAYRKDIKAGEEKWIPSNQEVCNKIIAKSDSIAAWLFDLEERTAMLLGVESNKIPIVNGSFNKAVIKYFTSPQRFTTYEVVEQHYKSRGADVVNIKPEDGTEYISVMAEDLVKDYTKVSEMIGE